MTFEQGICFSILGGMMVSFVWNKIRYDLTAMLGLLAGMAAGIVPVNRAFSGFSDQVVILVASALILSAGVGKSGLIPRLARWTEPYMRTPGPQVAALTSLVAALSTFMKNIGALAIFLRIALQISLRTGTSPSTLLMPMAFASLMGGLVTLVGTSPNIIVSRVREELLGTPYAMFDFAPVGLGILLCGLLFLAVGWRVLPLRRRAESSPEEAFSVDAYVVEAEVPRDSGFIGKTVAELEALADADITVTSIIREGGRRYTPGGHWWILENDILVLHGDAHKLQAITRETGMKVLGTEKTPWKAVAQSQLAVVEAVVMEGSSLVGTTSTELRLRDRFGVTLVGLSRPRQPSHVRLTGTRFQVGDVLILQGNAIDAPDVLRDLGCLPLVDRATGFGDARKDFLPLVILATAIVLIATNLVPVTAGFFSAAVVLILTRVLTLQEAYRAIDPPILVLLACLIPISDAISDTGTAEILANWLWTIARAMPPVGAVALIIAAAMAITPFLNNAATVLIMAPIAVSVSKKLGLNPDPFLMAVAIGAACDFLTPIGHQCNTLVMGPGGYRFGDYWKLGLPLTLMVLCVGTFLIPLFWSFR